VDVYDDLHKMKVKGWGEKMKNRENGGGLFRRPKLTLSCSAEGKEVIVGLMNGYGYS
jgi:hypothetical protein